jgi:DNA-binding GntR family transcriptional regulator
MTRRAIDPTAREFPYEQVAADIAARITAGEFWPGQMIPSETTLIEENEISRSTARRAVALLRDQGIVETRIRCGSFVAGDPG